MRSRQEELEKRRSCPGRALLSGHPTFAGNDGIIVASDEGQAKDDLAIARKLADRNRTLAAELEPLAKELRLRDGSGALRIIPARDVAGAHGKTYNFLGIDELHTARDWSLLEALAPDPTRADAR